MCWCNPSKGTRMIQPSLHIDIVMDSDTVYAIAIVIVAIVIALSLNVRAKND